MCMMNGGEDYDNVLMEEENILNDVKCQFRSNRYKMFYRAQPPTAPPYRKFSITKVLNVQTISLRQ
jgi:hypothetical protein